LESIELDLIFGLETFLRVGYYFLKKTFYAYNTVFIFHKMVSGNLNLK